MSRPRPNVATPRQSPASVPAPPDAVPLFDGTDLSKWRDAEGGPAKWKVADGAMISVPDSGYIYTADKFGDAQLHVEWAAPLPVVGRGQGRGNSGVFLMGLYEVQVLDSYDNQTYADGQAAAIYGQYPPLVNACLPPGQWQCYDIVFRRPRFNANGTLAKPARMTVLHNKPYTEMAAKLPLSLQDHGNPVRFRNLWIRPLREEPEDEPPPLAREVFPLTPDALQAFVGDYQTFLGEFGKIELDGMQLRLLMKTGQVIDLVPLAAEQFAMRFTAATLAFQKKGDQVTGFTLAIGGEKYPVQRVKAKN
jgi:hypothetical protein